MGPADANYEIEPDFCLVAIGADGAREKVGQMFSLVAEKSPLLQRVTKEMVIDCCRRHPELTAACDELMLALVAIHYPETPLKPS